MSTNTQKNNILFAILSLITVVVIVAIIGYFTIDRTEEIIQGEVEVSEYRVACKFPGRVTDIKVKEGDFVHKGDTLATLAIPEASTQEKVVEAAAGATDALSALAEAANSIAEKTYGRMQRLFDEGVMTEQKRDEALAAYEATKAGVEVAKSQWELAKNGAQKETKEAARKQAQAAHSAVEVVRSVLKETIQYATADGEVETIYPKVGELVGLGSPIMSISMIGDIWGTFNVREDQLKNMKVGKVLKAYVPALDKSIDLRVISLKDKGSYAVWKATKTNGQYDLKTFQVKVKPITKIEGLKAGMSLIVK